MYLFDPNRPTELFHERQEALIGEAPTQCEVAYLTSGPAAQLSSFEANCEHAV
jgi:hypothetical protein